MGNTLGGKKTAKIMKINGETMKFKTPIQAKEVVKDYPGHVVLDSDSVKHYGIRAKPLDLFRNLEPKKLYFLVELPKFPNDHQHRVPRRVQSGINMTAKDRLESLMLTRRSVSDLSIMGPATRVMVDSEPSHDGESESSGEGAPSSGLRLRMKLPKAELEKLMNQNLDQEAVAERIMDLCLGKNNNVQNGTKSSNINGVGSNYNNYNNNDDSASNCKGKEIMNGNSTILDHALARGSRGPYKKRVGFMPVPEGEIRLAVASS